MRVTIRLFASLRERAGSDQLVLDGLSAPLDVAGLKQAIEARHPELGSLAAVRGVIGTAYVSEDTAVEDGQELSLLPPVSGGAPDDDDALASGLFEIHATPLDVLDAQRRVAHDSCGAVVLFTGMTRDRNRGQDVERLDYEAFEEMAGAEMGRIFEACRARFGPEATGPEAGDLEPRERLLRMLVLHRTGTVDVGEPSVVIAVASPHRDAAYQASRFLIDKLKESVPLWKKEIYQDGHHWIGDRS